MAIDTTVSSPPGGLTINFALLSVWSVLKVTRSLSLRTSLAIRTIMSPDGMISYVAFSFCRECDLVLVEDIPGGGEESPRARLLPDDVQFLIVVISPGYFYQPVQFAVENSLILEEQLAYGEMIW